MNRDKSHGKRLASDPRGKGSHGVVVILLCALAVSYGVFLLLDIAGTAGVVSAEIKYTGILLCLAVSSCALGHPSRPRDAVLQCVALAFAV
ncbi:MAG: hypothetical protein LBL63_01015, partial [Clostridiales Family XIII bacterium]|nr:hypothetical protein [Clostridiales Family XIII bacterium]